MNDRNDCSYYRARAEEAQARARAATLPEVRRVHSEMAERYAALQREAERESRLAQTHPMLGIVHPG
ncbi:hypothetical protein [Sphingomonas sp. VNH70]|uniref:hypothetical protein n=1 Tax=Sphingomonas silueang TaxID=3156617 RepID=UPI0032B5D319